MITNRYRITPADYQQLGHSGAIITCGDKLLLVQGRKTGKWSLPKGHAQNNESPLSCAIREVQEETGLRLNYYNFDRKVIKLRVAYYFFVELPHEYLIDPIDKNEIMAHGWFSYNELINNPSMILNVDANRILIFLKVIYQHHNYHHVPHTDAPPLSDSITTS
jgi:8-oxo-dGTP pyrophosphatase MutT (NUDIX family)